MPGKFFVRSATALLAHLILLCIGGVKDAAAQSWPVIDKKTREGYYRLLESSTSDSSIDQITVLQNFLLDHPAFERAYAKLLERSMLQQRIPEAQRCFQDFVARSSHKRNSHWMLAKIYALQENFSQAEKEFSQALQTDQLTFSLLRDFLEFAYERSGKAEEPAILRSLKLPRTIRQLIFVFLNYQRWNYRQAIEVLNEIPREISHDMAVLHFWGQCYYRLPRYAQADSIWRIGLAIARDERDREMEAQFLINLGVLARLNHNYDLAMSYYDSASVIARRLDDILRRQILAGNTGNIHLDQGNYARALECYRTAITLADRIQAYSYSTFWYNSYGVILLQLGRFYEALQAYEESERLAQRMNNMTRFIELKIDRADVYCSLNQYEIAKAIYQEAYKLAINYNLQKQKYFALDRVAELMVREKEYEPARAIMREYSAFMKQQGDIHRLAGCLAKVAATYKAEQRYDLAKTYYAKAARLAHKVKSKIYEASYQLEIADLEVKRGNISLAIPIYENALKIAHAENNLNMLTQIYCGLGDAYQKIGNPAHATAFYTRATLFIEEARQRIKGEELRIGFFSTRYEVYRKLVECYRQLYVSNGRRADLDSFYYYAEMSRGRTLQDLSLYENAGSEGRSNGDFDSEYLQACTHLRLLQRRLRQEAEQIRPAEEWNHLLSQFEAARFSVIAQRLRLVKSDSISGSVRHGPLHLSAVLHDLKKAGLGLLHYHISNEAVFVLAAAGDSVRIVQLPMKPSLLLAAIDSLMQPFHSISGMPEQVPFRAAVAHRLYQGLVKPVEMELKLPPQLLIVPDLALTSLPFEMLLVAPPDKPEYTPGDFPDYTAAFLVQRYRIVYSPSTSVLRERTTVTSPITSLLIFANPVAGAAGKKVAASPLRAATGWSFEPLPFSELEAQKIEEIYPLARIYKRDKATKSRFIQEVSQQQVVHIASHAFVDTTFEAFSGLVLATAPDSTDDGMLMGYEIADLNFRCDLITLSACETGRGKLMAGEGVLGLPRLLLGAGAKTVLMTQWKVDDKFTSELMPEFYAYLLKGKLSKTEALSEAKRTMLRQQRVGSGPYYQHPFYWASFVLYGDPGINHTVGTPMVNFTIIVLVAILILAGFAIYLFYMHQHKL